MRTVLGCVCLMAATGLLAAQTDKAEPESANDLVRAVVENELAAAHSPIPKHMFRSFKSTPKVTQIHVYVETDDAMAGMLVALNGQPLSQEQLQTEDGHLAWLENNPDELRKKHAREKENLERSLRIIRALPEAFRYEYDGTEKSEPGLGAPGDELIKLRLVPNPGYQPPSRLEQVLTGMNGYLLIDRQARRLAEIDGTLFKEVEFGWGILGHLDKGGHFVVRQADVGDHSWEVTKINVAVTGRILLFKRISFSSNEVLSDFRRVPDDLTFAQGVQLLKADQEKWAQDQNSHESERAKNKQ